ncbi:PucR family transcriptional regulator [Acetobacterium wieringae]|uniref:Purine catabolism regulatory protein n=1 Tax=Acetobacterium wieringae TaxID=52694 RepID=A0A1F2PD80_9FIRM|nr:helix-turn-helix domain-containing protein [Acetobacterium wieringae]OFV69218.1 purine catabolism regulatory protein [Acetobacterium wieringae]
MAVIKATYSERKDKILNALIDRRGLQHFTDLAAEVMNNPLFIYDVSGKILAKSQIDGHKEIWEELLPQGYLNSEKSIITENSGVMKKLMEEDTPVIGEFSYSQFRFLGCRVRDKHGVVALVTIVEKEAFSSEDSDLLVIVCKAILFELLYQERTAMQTIPYFRIFKDIIEATASTSEIRERCRALHLDFPESMRLLGIKIDDSKNNTLSLFFLRETFLASVPFCYCIIYDESLIMVISEKHFSKSYLSKVQNIFSNYEIRIGVSTRFADILDVKSAFQEMQAIQSVYQKLNVEKSLIFYEEILLYHFMELASKEYDLNKFCLPILRTIEEYDNQNGTLLENSLEAYLEAGRNIQKASDRLHMHKNTLYYRLKRIEDFFDLDLDDENLCFNLQFSLRMKRMAR